MSKVYTLAEVAEHNTEKSCWLILGNDSTGGKKVYDLTKYLSDHPGGPEIMLEFGGKDADDMFEDIGHSSEARSKMKDLCIGTLQTSTEHSKRTWNQNEKDFAVVVPPPLPPASDLQSQVQLLLAQAAGVHARREWMQRRDALQAQYDTAEKALKFSEVAKLGKALIVVDAESTMSLSVEDYRTLADRHTQLSARVQADCMRKMQGKDFDALESLSQLLESLQALDAAALVFPTKSTAVYITD